VRLYQGDPAAETVYFASPLEAARHWIGHGARHLHLVDLDAATGRGDNAALVAEIAQTLAGQASFEVGGGVRSLERAQALLAGGVASVVIGTAAIERPALVTEVLAAHGPAALIVSIDARDGLVMLRGWAETSAMAASDLARQMWDLGVQTLIYTDVSRDGTLLGLDRAPLAQLRAAWPGRLLAGGGIRDQHDLALLGELGIEGAIVGRALYEGTLPASVLAQ
jgi:phosphoribosylformimino-5-aminoimidazole carboxamide ribotide isomerase